MKRMLVSLTLILCAALVLGACAGKKADTAEHDATLAVQASMHQLAVDHGSLATAWFKACTATPRAADVLACNAWDTADTAWRVKYRDVGDRLTGGASAASVKADIADLRSTLNKYKR
jgi:hypothetical protein